MGLWERLRNDVHGALMCGIDSNNSEGKMTNSVESGEGKLQIGTQGTYVQVRCCTPGSVVCPSHVYI